MNSISCDMYGYITFGNQITQEHHMTQGRLEERLKARKIYVSDREWRSLRSMCATEGISASEWARREITRMRVCLSSTGN